MPRSICFTANGWSDYLYWQTQDAKTLKRINKLIEEAVRTPFTGTGKPEPLKANLTGYWSRKIDQANRLVYAVETDSIVILTCRYHYKK